MRSVAIVLVILSTLSVMPAQAAEDECAPTSGGAIDIRSDTTAREWCISTGDRLARPNVPGVPSAPNEPYWGTYYVWFAPSRCDSISEFNDCRSQPPAPGSGIRKPYEVDPAGGTLASVSILGLVFQNTNGIPGLQRAAASGSPPDRMILL